MASREGRYTLAFWLLAVKHKQQRQPNWFDPTPEDCSRVDMGWFEHRVFMSIPKNRFSNHFLHSISRSQALKAAVRANKVGSGDLSFLKWGVPP